MSKLSDSVNSDLGNGSFSLEIPHAEHVDRRIVEICASSLCEFDRINRPLTQEMFTFLDMRAMLVPDAVLVPTFVFGGVGAPPLRAILLDVCMYVCHRGHYEGLSRCRLVGSCVLLGEDFFK